MAYTDGDLRRLAVEAVRAYVNDPTVAALPMIPWCVKWLRDSAAIFHDEVIPIQKLTPHVRWAIEHQDGPSVAEQLAEARAQRDRLAEFARTLIRLDEPDNRLRQSITLPQIIEQAREVLASTEA